MTQYRFTRSQQSKRQGSEVSGSTDDAEDSSTHSAAASVLGYLHQTQWGLLELLKKRRRSPDAKLTLEMHDDVAWDVDGSPTELNQLKLHTTGSNSLGNSSVDLWRTIGVWLDNGRPADPHGPILTLITNSTAADGSIAAMLRAVPETRDTAEALKELEDIAETSSNKETKKARDKFMKLGPSARATFIERVVVADASKDLAGVETELRDILTPGAPLEHFDTYFDQVLGWWSRTARAMLSDGRGLTVGQMLAALERTRDQFSSENLPPLVYPDEIDIPLLRSQHTGRTYIQQLLLIGLKPRPIEKAILDYQRAYLQETRWLERDLIDPVELDRFEESLVDEWEREYDFVCDELDSHASEDDRQRAGRQLLNTLSNSTLAIRARFDDPFFSRGQRHALADQSKIGWHPTFENHLAQMLLDSSSGSA